MSNSTTNVPGRKLAIFGISLLLSAGVAGAILNFTLGPVVQKIFSGNESNIESIFIGMLTGLFGLLAGILIIFILVIGGGICLMVSIWGDGYRATWLLWTLVIIGFAFLFLFPCGTLIGAGLLLYLYQSKNEFMNPTFSSSDIPPLLPIYSFAGFWKRFMALLIDCVVVSIVVFPFVVGISLFTHDLILVEVPFDLFTTRETISENEEKVENSDKSTSIVIKEHFRETVLNHWSYHYEKTTTKSGGKSNSEKTLIDSVTGKPKEMTDTGDIEFYVIFIYWVLLERSRLQGSVGKWIMGIHVVDLSGAPLTWAGAIQRNLFKILSATIAFIGFMMAGWTQKKQGLHDIISKSLVVNRG